MMNKESQAETEVDSDKMLIDISSAQMPQNPMLSVVYPDKVKLQNEYLVSYGKEFLRINNLKVGDEIDLEFPYEGVSQKYKSREMEKFSYKTTTRGILKLDDVGRLYAESIKDLVFYEYTSNGYSGRNRKSWYK